MRLVGRLTSLAVLICAASVALPAVAQERDDDGTRMQARQVDVDATYSGQLSPPGDVADWRVVQLEEGRQLTLELTVQPSERTAELTLTSATGSELDTATADNSASISSELNAGIYYIAVESSEELRYDLAIQ